MDGKNEITVFGEIKNGDTSAFNGLFDTYYTKLCFFANKYLCDIDLSRSVVQQVFVDLWIKRDKLDIKESVKNYLYYSVRNASIDQLRKKKIKESPIELIDEKHHIPFRDLVEEAELDEKINSAIRNLPEKCREIFELCRYEGLKYAQIADALNISVKTVEMQMGIALKRLRGSLSDYQMVNLLAFILSKK